MKKRIVLLSIMLLLVSGCSVQTLSTTSFEDNISMILSEDTTLANVNFDGYQYYVPDGMRFVNKDAYYSKKLNYNKKNGYIEINEIGDEYFVEMVFNYCKIEAYIPKKYLIPVINNMSYILQSVDFHDKILESLIGENVLNYKEESFNIFESKEDTDDSVLKYEDYQQADINSANITDEDNFEVNEIDQKR